MPWFQTEDRVIPVVRSLNEDGYPNIRFHLFRNLRKRGLHFPQRREYEARVITEMRCFYTGAQLHLTDTTLFYGNNFNILPWAATKEHVAAKRGNDTNKTNTLGNIVPCAFLLNRMMAHMPVAVKIYERDCLSKFDFDRDNMSLEVAGQVRKIIIDKIEKPFWFEGNYPWFSHVYVGDKARPEIEEFARVLREFEDAFLNLPWQKQREYLKQPLQIDLPEIAHRILGVGK